MCKPLIVGLFCGKWPIKIRHPNHCIRNASRQTHEQATLHIPAHAHEHTRPHTSGHVHTHLDTSCEWGIHTNNQNHSSTHLPIYISCDMKHSYAIQHLKNTNKPRYTWLHTYTHTWLHTYTHTWLHTYTHTRLHTYTHTWHYTCIVRVCVSRTHTHIHTHIYTHTNGSLAHTTNSKKTIIACLLYEPCHTYEQIPSHHSYTRTHRHTHTRTHTHTHTHTRTVTYTTHTHTHKHKHTHIHTHTNKHRDVYYTHTHAHTHTRTHIHTHTVTYTTNTKNLCRVHIYQSCHTCERVMSHISAFHVTYPHTHMTSPYGVASVSRID